MRRFSAFVIATATVFLLSGCGAVDTLFLPTPEDTAQELFENGQNALVEKNYNEAVEQFTKLKDRYPFSPFTVEAELMLGDAFFLNGNYQEAVEAYREFEALHPRHEEIDYVLFQIGNANRRRFKSIDLPQQHVQESLEYFTRLVETYPDSEYVEPAREAILESLRYLADHEIYVADFNWRREQYGAAWRRYEYVAENFKSLPKMHEYAVRRAEMAYFRHQRQISERIRVKDQGSWKKWFDWL